MDNTDHKAARRVNEQYHCHHCGKQWDYDDPDPPECVDDHKVEGYLSCTNSEGETCEQCNECATFCDVCGFWYPDPNPCRYH